MRTAQRSVLLAKIHPTAIVDPKAELDCTVEIGPGCLISGPVVIGEGTRLLSQVNVHGPVTIGRGNTLYPFTCIGYAPQDRKFDPSVEGAGVEIGHDNVLREGVTIHRATGDQPTRVGDDNYLMSNSHLGHDVVLGNECMLANGALIGGHAQVADQVLLGGNAGLHQFCRLGRLSVLSGAAGISKDLPPFCTCYKNHCVGSLNIIGLRRANYRHHIQPLQRAFNIFFRQCHTNQNAIEQIENELNDDPLCMEFAQFIKQSQRGINEYLDRH